MFLNLATVVHLSRFTLPFCQYPCNSDRLESGEYQPQQKRTRASEHDRFHVRIESIIFTPIIKRSTSFQSRILTYSSRQFHRISCSSPPAEILLMSCQSYRLEPGKTVDENQKNGLFVTEERQICTIHRPWMRELEHQDVIKIMLRSSTATKQR